MPADAQGEASGGRVDACHIGAVGAQLLTRLARGDEVIFDAARVEAQAPRQQALGVERLVRALGALGAVVLRLGLLQIEPLVKVEVALTAAMLGRLG